MPIIIIALLFFGGLVFSMPLLLVLRYRAGTMRRRGRKWAATLNLITLMLSAALFLWVAAMTNLWVPNAFKYSILGLAGGCLLGLFGLALTHWEPTPQALYFTPNRWLVLLITLAVTGRLLYGLYRIWHAWRTAGADDSWLAAAGIAGSMAVGAVVIGYYLTYSAGVRWRLGLSRRASMRSGGVARIVLIGFCLTAISCELGGDFPTEGEMNARLRVGMTVDEVLKTFGPPRTGVGRTAGPSRLLYVSPIGTRTVQAEGYVGFEVQFVDGKVQSWRTLTGHPSHAPVKAPKELKWSGYYFIALFVGVIVYGLFRGFRRGLSEEQILLKAYEERSIPKLPAEFRFINNDTTLQEVVDRVGPPARERKFPIDPSIVTAGYGYTEGPLGLPAIVLIEYDLPYHAVVALLPEYPFEPESRIRAAFYRRPLPDEDL